MLPEIVNQYKKDGFSLHLGDNNTIFSRLYDENGVRLQGGGGISVTDTYFLMVLSRTCNFENILIIGNAFGVSTLTISELFPNSKINVIDAEIEGEHNSKGSDITRKINNRFHKNVNLIKGFAPEDLKGFGDVKYDFIFDDGLHTNEQVLKDYNGFKDLVKETSFILFHDVGLAKMNQSWSKIKDDSLNFGYKHFDLSFTQFGLTCLSKGNEKIEEFLDSIYNKHTAIEEIKNFWFGFNHLDQMIFLDDRSKIYIIKLYIKYFIKKALRLH